MLGIRSLGFGSWEPVRHSPHAVLGGLHPRPSGDRVSGEQALGFRGVRYSCVWLRSFKSE